MAPDSFRYAIPNGSLFGENCGDGDVKWEAAGG